MLTFNSLLHSFTFVPQEELIVRLALERLKVSEVVIDATSHLLLIFSKVFKQTRANVFQRHHEASIMLNAIHQSIRREMCEKGRSTSVQMPDNHMYTLCHGDLRAEGVVPPLQVAKVLAQAVSTACLHLWAPPWWRLADTVAAAIRIPMCNNAKHGNCCHNLHHGGDAAEIAES
jgi:hypothetical protein